MLLLLMGKIKRSVMFQPHGSHEFSFDEENSILRCVFSGSWNKEVVAIMIQEFNQIKLPEKWASLGILNDFNGVLPDALELYKLAIDRSAENGLCATAMVCPESKSFFLDSQLMYRKDEHNLPMKNFENEDDAKQWLIEMLKDNKL